jgi:hypothetical protein
MGVCQLLTAGIVFDCNANLVGGVKDRMILVNLEDILSITRDSANPQIIEDIVLKTGKVGYVFEGQRNSNDASSEFVKARYSVGYNHQIVFRAFGNNAAIKKTMEQLAKGSIVAFPENNFKGTDGDAAFEVYGLEVGLQVDSLGSNKSDAETGGAYVITLKTPDDFKEPHLPATIFDTDYATSKAIVDSLLVAAS